MIRLAVILCLLPIGTFAQFSVQGGLSYGTFSMNSMKALQNDISIASDSLLKAVTTFPSYYGFSASLLWTQNEKASIGIAIDFNSTGGRLSYSDYSGYLLVDQVLTAFSIGAVGEYKLNKSARWPISAGIQVSWVSSTVEITRESAIGNSPPSSDAQVLSSTNIGVRPHVLIQRNLPAGLYAFVQAGYELQYHKQLETSGGGKTNLTAEWDGFRALVGVGFRFRSGNSQPTQ